MALDVCSTMAHEGLARKFLESGRKERKLSEMRTELLDADLARKLGQREWIGPPRSLQDLRPVLNDAPSANVDVGVGRVVQAGPIVDRYPTSDRKVNLPSRSRAPRMKIDLQQLSPSRNTARNALQCLMQGFIEPRGQ